MKLVDESAWAARSAREKVILWGLVDWVELERVHDFVAEENPGAQLSILQDQTLDMIGSLVAESLFVIGDLTGPGNRFTPWGTSLDDSLRRIRSEYVNRFEDKTIWPWLCWLDLTDEGTRVAHELEARIDGTVAP
jgi:hypothetical protein